MSKAIDVACLVLVSMQGRFLTTLRPAQKTLGNHWEFPGGKVESGERPEIALRRELREDLHLEVNSLEPLPPNTHAYDFAIVRLLPFLSYCEDFPQIHLAEHAECRWVNMNEARELIWAPADIPILESLNSYLAP